MTRAKPDTVFHRDFLGAHRYTTRGGTARPAGGVLRTALPAPQSRGDAPLPLRCARHTYPDIDFASQKGRNPRPSFVSKSAMPSYHDQLLPKKRKARCRHGY